MYEYTTSMFCSALSCFSTKSLTRHAVRYTAHVIRFCIAQKKHDTKTAKTNYELLCGFDLGLPKS